MPSLEVKRCNVADLIESASFVRLSGEYVAESGRAITAIPTPQIEFYQENDLNGSMQFAGAWLDGELVGMMVVAFVVVPHFGMMVANTETLFVTHSARSSGAGKQLLALADDMAADKGCVGVLISAPVGGVLAKILPRSGFAHTNELFFKAVK